MNEKPNFGMCPIMSKAVIKPGPPSNIVNLPSANAQFVETVILTVPCPGENCQLWDGYQNMCSLKSSPGIANAIEKNLERPRS